MQLDASRADVLVRNSTVKERETIVANEKMLAQVCEKQGFFAALDQSGGSTPGALRLYGIPETAYNGDAEMFKLIHEMRVRIITAPAFTGTRSSAPSCSKRPWTDRLRANPFRPSCGKSAASYRS
ncbi:beta/alpha barrel domain-containing protein [Paraburkholderia dipogonis]|nr:hypothetical protein [Paraburkholderia dipogonis]